MVYTSARSRYGLGIVRVMLSRFKLSRFVVTGQLACLVVVITGLPELARAAMPASEKILPAATQGFISFPSMHKLTSALELTPIGRLLDDPEMQAFREDVKDQLHGKGVLVQDRLGISLSDLETLPSGEVAMALIRRPDHRATTVLLVDVTDNLPAAGQTLQKIDAILKRRGAKRTAHTSRFAQAPLTVYEIQPKGRAEPIHAIYFIENGVLGAGDNLETIEEILRRLSGSSAPALADAPGYKAAMKRCAEAPGPKEYHLRWWVDPIGALETVQNTLPEKPSRNLVALARKEGFDAVQAVGGMVTFATGRYGMVHRTAVIAPPPYQRAMRMLVLPNAPVHEPESWVPAKVANYMTFQVDVLNAFDNFGTLFDELVGGGEEGVWGDVIESMKNDPNGPQLDLRNDLVAHLGKRCSILTDNVTPIGPHSQRRLFAAEAVNDKALAAAVERAMKNDAAIKMRVFRVGEMEYKIFEIVPEEHAVPVVQVEAAGAASEPAAHVHPLPHSAVTVGKGYLFISSHVDLLEQILSQSNAASPLSSSSDYRSIAAQFAELDGGPRCGQGFTREDERFFVPYELFRQGRLPEADLPVAQALNALLNDPDAPEGQVRKSRLNGSTLPDYAVVRKYLGLGGSYVQSDPGGWFVFGFTTNGPHEPQAAHQTPARSGNTSR